jgi:hypothetical protein
MPANRVAPKMKIVNYLGIIGLVVFAYIIYSIGSVQIVESILGLDPFFFCLALLVLVPSVAIKAWRQCLLADVFGPRLGFPDSARIWIIGFFFSVISPGKAGNVVKSVYFKETLGLPMGKGLSVVVVERFFDIVILLLFVLLGLGGLSFYFLPGIDLLLPLALVFAGLALLAFLLAKKNAVLIFARPVYRHLVPKRFGPMLKAGFHQFFEGIDAYKSRRLVMLKVGAISVLSWFVAIAMCYLIALSLHIDVPFSYLFMVIPVVNLLSILPIAFSGIGTREASLVFFLGLVGVPAGTAVSFSLLIFLSDLLLGLVGWLIMQGQKNPNLKKNFFSKAKGN